MARRLRGISGCLQEEAGSSGTRASRSGNGGHVWIFFSEPIPAALARKLGSALLTEAMECNPDMGFGSYDRLFPSQDVMPYGGFGNLIALPLRHGPAVKETAYSLTEISNPMQTSGNFCRQ